MIARPVDEYGDMRPIWSADQMLTGAHAVGQAVSDNLHLIRGEWWEDEELGILIPDYFANTVKQGDIDMITNYLSSTIAKMEGVRGVTDVWSTFEHREMVFHCVVIAENGTDELEVSLNGLL